jgi:hypothetical protein
MKKVLLTAILGLLSVNCAGVTSGQPTTASVTGDTWYSKDSYILTHVFTTSSDVYYCPKETPQKCMKADIRPD